MVDGDNEGNPFPKSDRFIHLPVYCSENVVLDPEILASAFQKPLLVIQEIIVNAILSNKERILKKNKFLDFLLAELKPEQITYERISSLDGGVIIAHVASKLGVSEETLIAKAFGEMQKANLFAQRLPQNLLKALNDDAAPVVDTLASQPSSGDLSLSEPAQS